MHNILDCSGVFVWSAQGCDLIFKAARKNKKVFIR